MNKKTFYGVLAVFIAAIIAFFGCFLGIPEFNALVKNAFKSDKEVTVPDDGKKPTDGDSDETHVHTYDLTKWYSDEEYHYHKATCEHLIVKDLAEHTYANGVCSVCGYKTEGVKADMLITDGEENGIMLTSSLIAKDDYLQNGISTYAETAYTLTATVYDENHTTNGMPQAVDAVGSFENTSSEWAQGKNVSDYVIITRLSENSFNVVCKKAFGAPIIITVTAKDTDKSVTTRCDYVKRVSNVDVHAGIDYAIVINFPIETTDNEVYYGDGTLQGLVTFNNITFYLESDFMNALMNTSYYKYFAQQCEAKELELDLGSEVVKELNCNQSAFERVEFNLEDILLTNMDVAQVNAIKNQVGLDYFKYAVIAAAKEVGNNAVRFEIQYSYSYKGVVYSTGIAYSGPPQPFNTNELGSVPAVGDIGVGGSFGGTGSSIIF